MPQELRLCYFVITLWPCDIEILSAKLHRRFVNQHDESSQVCLRRKNGMNPAVCYVCNVMWCDVSVYKDVNKHPCINALSLTQGRYLPTPRATCKNTPTSDMPDKPCVTRWDGVFWNVGVFYQHLAAVWKLGEMSEKGGWEGEIPPNPISED